MGRSTRILLNVQGRCISVTKHDKNSKSKAITLGCLLFILLVPSILMGCSDDKSDEPQKPLTNNEQEEIAQENELVTPLKSEVIDTEYGKINRTELNKELIDSLEYKVTAKYLERSDDDELGKSANIIFEVTNRLGVDLTFQAESLKVDDKDVPVELYGMSQKVSAGKTATVRLAINEQAGLEFPSFSNKITLQLDIFNWEDFDIGEKLPVTIVLK